MNTGNSGIGGYEDIHGNVRFWLNRIVSWVGDAPLVIYDIGANDGELTLPLCGPRRRVIAFEPGPAARGRLRTCAEKAGVDRSLTIVPVALAADAGTATLQVYSDDTFSSLHERPMKDLEQYNLEAVESLTVTTVALDTLTADHREQVPEGVPVPLPPPDLVKIDVEGAERSVLQGALETLRKWQPAVVMEYSCVNTGNAGYRREELLSLLHATGYREIFGLNRNEDRDLYCGDALESCRIWNVLALSPRFHGVLTGVAIHETLPQEDHSPR